MSSGERSAASAGRLIAIIVLFAAVAVGALVVVQRQRAARPPDGAGGAETPSPPAAPAASGASAIPASPDSPFGAFVPTAEPTFVIYRGEVCDALARRIPGATVTAGAVPADDEGAERVVRADDEGRFEIGIPIGERPFVRIEAPGHPRLVVELEREPRVPYLLFRGGTIRGTVRGTTGGPDASADRTAAPVPLPGLRIEVAGTEGWSDAVTTDAEGRYSVTAPRGAVVLTVRSPAHRDAQILDVEALIDEETVRDIVLEPGIELEAIVIADGAPLAGAHVRALTDFGEEGSGRTDGAGRIVLGGLSPGSGRLVVVHPGYRAELPSLSLPEGSSRIRRTVTLERCAPFTLEVVDSAGQPRPDATVRIRLEQIELVTAAAGDPHALQVLGRDRAYSLDVAAADAARVRLRYRVPDDASPRLRVVLPAGSRFVGTAVDGRGNPVAGAGVLIVSLAATEESWGTPQLSTTAVDGTFRSELLAPGPYRVQVHHPHLGRTSVDTSIVEGQDRDLGKVALPEPR